MRSFSSLAVAPDDSSNTNNALLHKHCNTCTCDASDGANSSPVLEAEAVSSPEQLHVPCLHQPFEHHHHEPLPPPHPNPNYSVRRRVLPPTLQPLNSLTGRRLLQDCLRHGTAASFVPLMEHFCNQSDPAYCGVTTLLIVLNALAVDPNIRWKGGWRYFGNEDVLLTQCCLQTERIRRVGISMDEFATLGACQGLGVTMKRANDTDIHEFRRDLQSLLQEPAASERSNDDDTVEQRSSTPRPVHDNNNNNAGIAVVSFSRSALGQTGEGHFSPVAAYHVATDQVLVLDVARFKYPPYWVGVRDLYRAMCPVDATTEQSRGWYILRPPSLSNTYKGTVVTTEERRPAELVPLVGEAHLCPVHSIKIDYCKAAGKRTAY